LFSIGTINLPKTIQYVKTIDVEIMDISGYKTPKKGKLAIGMSQK
jgi:hypothetical protein